MKKSFLKNNYLLFSMFFLFIFGIKQNHIQANEIKNNTKIENNHNGKLVGNIIKNESLDSLKNVKVVLKDMNGNIIQETFTNEDGSFTFTGLKSQQYSIETELNNFQFYRDNENDIFVFEGETTQVKFYAEEIVKLNDIIITGFRVKQPSRDLSGFSSQSVSGSKVNSSGQSDLTLALAGKVSGAQVIGGSSATFDEGFLRIRGETGAIFIVDGIKVYSMADINTSNIETISVLKGAAAAIYGADASNGVVLINTKKAKAGKTEFKFSNTYQLSEVAVLPEYQNEYGGGYYQMFDTFEYNPATDPAEWAAFDGHKIPYYAADESWGPKLDGTMVRHWDSWIPGHPEFGKLRPWSANPNNVKDFYDTGIEQKTSFEFYTGTEKSRNAFNFRMIDAKLVMPNTEKKQYDFSFNSINDLTERLTFNVNLNYQSKITKNVPVNGYGGLGSNFNQWFQRQLDINRLKNNYHYNGNFYSWNRRSVRNDRPQYWDSPYFAVEQNNDSQNKEAIFGSIGIQYDIFDFLTAKLDYKKRTNIISTENIIAAFGGLESPAFSELNTRISQDELFGLLEAQHDIDLFSITGVVGFQTQDNRFKEISAETVGGLSVPGFYSINTSVDKPSYQSEIKKSKLNSLFTTLSIDYNNLIQLDASFRSDWSSTANAKDNRIDTTGTSLSFLVDEIFKTYVPKSQKLFDSIHLSSSKVRFGYVDSPVFPKVYQTTSIYEVGNAYGTKPSLSVPTNLANPNLEGGTRNETEIGLALGFFDERLSFDITQFDRKDKKLPVSIPVPASTGFKSLSLNSGQTSSKGLELSVGIIPIKTDDWMLDMTFNIATLSKKVDFIYENINKNVLDSWMSWYGLQLQEVVGEDWGVFVGRKTKVDDQGRLVLDRFGRTTAENNQILGKLLPDSTGGLNTTLSYKNWKLFMAIDFQNGGSVYSNSNMFAYYAGLHEDTAGLNDKGNPKRDPVSQGGGVHVVGVDADGNEVDKYIEANRWGSSFFGKHDRWLYDTSFVKLRELSLSYRLDNEIVNKTPFKGIEVSLIGRNLLLLSDKIKDGGFDPSEIEGSGSISSEYRSVEGGQLPSVRTYGLNISLEF